MFKIAPPYGMSTLVRIAHPNGASASVIRTAGASIVEYSHPSALLALARQLGPSLPRPLHVLIPFEATGLLETMRNDREGRWKLLGRVSDRSSYLLTLI